MNYNLKNGLWKCKRLFEAWESQHNRRDSSRSLLAVSGLLQFGEDVQYRHQIQPTFQCRNVGGIDDPFFVFVLSAEVLY